MSGIGPVLALDSCIAHRARAKEVKDGNPLKEVRMLFHSNMDDGNVICADR